MKKIKYNKNIILLIMMVLITCATQVITLMKSSAVAGIFGVSSEMDAYNFANSIVSFIFGIIASGIPTIIIPSYVKREDRAITDSFLTIIYGVLLISIIVLAALRYQIVSMLSGRNEIFVNIVCQILLVLLLAQYLMAITNVTIAYAQCANRYNTPKIINLLSQLLVVVILLNIRDISIYEYTWIIAGGIILNFGLNILFSIRLGWRYKPSFHIRSVEIKKKFAMFIPILFSSGIYQLVLFIDSIIVTQLDTGKLTLLSYSSQIASMTNSLLIGNLLIYAYPKIVARIGDKTGQKIFWEQTFLFHSIVCLVIAGFATVGREGVVLLFQHGSFNSQDAYRVYIGALIYIIGQQTDVVRDLIYRYFYAKENTKTTAYNSMIISIINIVLSILLIFLFDFYGIILGTILASVISLIMIIIKFDKVFRIDIPISNLLGQYIKNLIIMLGTILIVMYTKVVLGTDSIIISIFIFGCETVLVYLILTYLANKKILQILKRI